MFSLKVNKDIKLALAMPFMANEIFTLAMANKEHIGEWMVWVEKTKEPLDTQKFIEHALEGLAKGEMLACTIYYQGKIAGLIDLHSIRKSHKKASIGYWLDSSSQGRGIMSKSLQALCAFAFEKLELNKLIILCDKENIKSQNVAKRAGFQEEGLLKQELKVHNEFRDFYRYALLKEEFEHVRA